MTKRYSITLTIHGHAPPPARTVLQTVGEVVRHKPIRAIVPVQNQALARRLAKLQEWLSGAA